MNMMKVDELLYEAEQLSAAEKWRLVKYVLHSLETEQQTNAPVMTDWHTFLRETYGSLQDTPIQRWEQGEYEEREPLE
jgi:hypothetical protein